MAANRPKPPPLDDAAPEDAVDAPAAVDAVPLATSGRATADDADAAARDAAAAARKAAAPPDPPRPADATPTAPDDDRPRALISDASGVYVARPDPTRPISLTAAVVNGNWCGQHKGKQAHVKHGTPIDDLPVALQRSIRETRGQVVGPLPPKPQQNPFTP